ncbi:MAG: hypothetical protein U0941_14515 [Planctomycetaceae bacterium]
MSIWKEYALPVVAVVFVIVSLIAARLTRHRQFNLLRGLSICMMCAGGFAESFLRFGWDKTAVAFLIIYVPTALIAIGRWSELRRYQSTLPPKEPSEKVPS